MNKTLTFDHSKTIHQGLCRLTGCLGSRELYTQLSRSLSASMSGVLALTSPPRLSSHSLSGLSRGSGLRARPRSPSWSWRLPGEASLCLLARLAEPDTRVGVRHLSTAPGPGILDHDNVIRVNILWKFAGYWSVMRCEVSYNIMECSEQWGGVIVAHSCRVPQYFNSVVLFNILNILWKTCF